jgi:chromosome segregation ATPase
MTRRPDTRSRRLSGTSGEGSVPPVAIVLLVLIAVLIGATLYLYLELRTTKTQMAEQFQVYDEQLAGLEGSVNRTSREVGTQVAQVKGMVATAEKDIANAAVQVEQRVLGRTANLEKDLAATKEQQEAALQAVGGQLNQLNEVASTNNTRVGALSGEVDTVRSDLTAAQEEIRQTIADLKSVQGDLGVQSGLVATNGTELMALKRLGQRNYYEFDIQRSKDSQRVGRIQIRLRSTNDKRGRFTLDVIADDKEIEKKNKTLLEPIQFYVIGSKVPYEIVVNQLEKNRIVGYLATPLEDGARPTAGTDD